MQIVLVVQKIYRNFYTVTIKNRQKKEKWCRKTKKKKTGVQFVIMEIFSTYIKKVSIVVFSVCRNQYIRWPSEVK